MSITIPVDILSWPDDLKHQWLADELWQQATDEQDPAPAAFVNDFLEAARLVLPEIST